MALTIDTSGEFGRRAERRLRDERLAWLTTVGADGTPRPVPVWFLRDAGGILIYSEPDKPKLRNIDRNPRVSLHLDGNGEGGDIVILTGTARRSEDPPADQIPAYVEKYLPLIERNGWSAASFAQRYSTPVRLEPERLSGH